MLQNEEKLLDESRQGEVLILKSAPGLTSSTASDSKKVFLESYGCAMNFADSEIVASILKEKGFSTTSNFNEANVILVNTCAIRENAESRVDRKSVV